MPIEWLQVLAHPTSEDKASLLYKLKYEMTIEDVHDLIEYQQYENWMNHEEMLNSQKENNNANR